MRTFEETKELLSRNTNQWKDDKSRWRTRSLFWELANNEQRANFTPPYTTYSEDIERDGKHYRSLKKLYMSYDHVPGLEYDFATECLGGWEHWCLLATAKTALANIIAEWRAELEVKQRAEAIKAMLKTAKEEGGKGFSAAKYLADKGYAPQRGRPSKEEVERERKIQAGIGAELEEDLARIQLTLVKG